MKRRDILKAAVAGVGALAVGKAVVADEVLDSEPKPDGWLLDVRKDGLPVHTIVYLECHQYYLLGKRVTTKEFAENMKNCWNHPWKEGGPLHFAKVWPIVIPAGMLKGHGLIP